MVTKPKLKVLWVADYSAPCQWTDNVKASIIESGYDLEHMVNERHHTNPIPVRETTPEGKKIIIGGIEAQTYTSLSEIDYNSYDLVIFQIDKMEDYEKLPVTNCPQILLYEHNSPGNFLILPDNQKAVYMYHTNASEIKEHIIRLIGEPRAANVIQLPAMAKRA